MDIILLAMIAGFIFLRLRGILGKKTGFEGKIPSQFVKEFEKINSYSDLNPISEKFDEVGTKRLSEGSTELHMKRLLQILVTVIIS